MAQSNVNMSKLKRSFQMLAAKIPQRTICEQLHMGPVTRPWRIPKVCPMA